MAGIIKYLFNQDSFFCSKNESFYTAKVTGKVISIKDDFDSVRKHPMPTVYILTNKTDTCKFLNFYKEFDFNFLVNDSLSKEMNTFIFSVYRDDSLIFVSENYKCSCSYCKK